MNEYELYKTNNLIEIRSIFPHLIEKTGKTNVEFYGEYIKKYPERYENMKDIYTPFRFRRDIPIHELIALFEQAGYILHIDLNIDDDPKLEEFLNKYYENDLFEKLVVYSKIKKITLCDIKDSTGFSIATIRNIMKTPKPGNYNFGYNVIKCSILNNFVHDFSYGHCSLTYYCYFPESVTESLKHYMETKNWRKNFNHYSKLFEDKIEEYDHRKENKKNKKKKNTATEDSE